MSEEGTTDLTLDLRTAPVPKEAEAGWQKLLSSPSNLNLKRAVYRAVVLNQPFKDAANEEGCSLNGAWKLARRYGLAGRTQKQITQSLSRLVTLASDNLEEDLIHGRLSPKDTAVVMGIASDKLSRQWEKHQAPSSYVSLLDRLAQKLEQGGTVRFEMTVTPADQAIDVTPSQPGTEQG